MLFRIVLPLVTFFFLILARGDSYAATQDPNEPQVILKGIKGINLYVRILPRDAAYFYQTALTCHQLGDKCANLTDDAHREAFLHSNKEIYAAYPRPLLPETLTPKIVQIVKDTLSALLPKKPQGKPAEINVMTDAPMGHCIDVTTPAEAVSCARKTVFDYANDPSTVTLTIDITIENDIDKYSNRYPVQPFDIYNQFSDVPVPRNVDPRLVHLRASLFRQNCQENYLAYLTDSQRTIAFNWGEQEVERQVNTFVEDIGLWLQVLKQNSVPVLNSKPFSCYVPSGAQ